MSHHHRYYYSYYCSTLLHHIVIISNYIIIVAQHNTTATNNHLLLPIISADIVRFAHNCANGRRCPENSARTGAMKALDMDAEILSVNRLNAKIISALGRRQCDAAHRLVRRALKKLSALTSRCHTSQCDKLYIAFANTYCNLACIYRSQKKGTRAKLSIGYAISFSQHIQDKKDRILNVITALINLTVIDSELNHSETWPLAMHLAHV